MAHANPDLALVPRDICMCYPCLGGLGKKPANRGRSFESAALPPPSGDRMISPSRRRTHDSSNVIISHENTHSDTMCRLLGSCARSRRPQQILYCLNCDARSGRWPQAQLAANHWPRPARAHLASSSALPTKTAHEARTPSSRPHRDTTSPHVRAPCEGHARCGSTTSSSRSCSPG